MFLKLMMLSKRLTLRGNREVLFFGGGLFVAVYLILTLFVAERPFVQAQTETRVIVFLWDGAQRSHMLDAYNANELPRLQALVNDGGLLRTDMVINTETCEAGSGDGYDLETGPANSAIVTGYGYPEMANQDNSDPHPIPAGYTFFERVTAAYPEVKTGMISGKFFDFWPTTPLSNASSAIDYWYGSRQQDDVIADEAINFLQTYGSSPFFLWVHFRHPDEAGHRFGENSDTYHEQLLNSDMEMGRVLDELAALGLDDDTVVLVTTDHGFGEGARQHEACISDNWDVWLAGRPGHVIGNLEAMPYQTAIGATLYDIFGMDKNVSPPLASESLWLPPNPPTSTLTPTVPPTMTGTPTTVPTASPTGTLTATATISATVSATPTNTPTPIGTPTLSPTPTSTAVPTLTPTATPETAPPENGTFAPDGGSGVLGQPITFTTTYHDANGWEDIRFGFLLLNVNRQTSQGMFVRYYQDANRLSLRSDGGDQWIGPCTPGEAAVLANSYVSLDCEATMVSGSGDTLTIVWQVTPLAPFSGQYGAYEAYLLAQDDGDLWSGWGLAGSWTLAETVEHYN